MSSEQAIWLAGAALAWGALMAMMRKRQSQLNAVLRKAVQQKRDWARQRHRAAQLALRALNARAAEETRAAEDNSLLQLLQAEARTAEELAEEVVGGAPAPAAQFVNDSLQENNVLEENNPRMDAPEESSYRRS